jgi:hypothetical protein
MPQLMTNREAELFRKFVWEYCKNRFYGNGHGITYGQSAKAVADLMSFDVDDVDLKRACEYNTGGKQKYYDRPETTPPQSREL